MPKATENDTNRLVRDISTNHELTIYKLPKGIISGFLSRQEFSTESGRIGWACVSGWVGCELVSWLVPGGLSEIGH